MNLCLWLTRPQDHLETTKHDYLHFVRRVLELQNILTNVKTFGCSTKTDYEYQKDPAPV